MSPLPAPASSGSGPLWLERSGKVWDRAWQFQGDVALPATVRTNEVYSSPTWDPPEVGVSLLVPTSVG